MNSWSKWGLILVSLMVLILLNGCGPNLQQIKAGMQEQYSLPDNYSIIQDHPKINRPILVIQHHVKHPTDKANKQKSAGLTAAEKQMTENNRNVLIRRLFETKAFRQILPHDDPNDPSLPEDTLILEATQKEVRISKNTRPDWRTGMMETKTDHTIIIRDPRTGYSSLTKFEFFGSPNHKTGMSEFTFNIDDKEKLNYEIKSSDPDYFNKMFHITCNALDQIIDVMTNKLAKEGY